MGVLDIPVQIWGSIYNNEQDWARQKDAQLYDWEKLGEQWRQNEKSADNADARARKYYLDLQSPESMVKQLEAAGLSPSLMYSGSGMGAGGGTMMAKGGAGSGGGPIGAGNPAMTTGGDTPLELLADVNLKNAQARKLNVDADTAEGKNERGQNEINKITKEVDLVASMTKNQDSQAILNGAKVSLTETQTAWQTLENALKTDTFSAQVQQYQASAAKAWQDLEIGSQVLVKEKVAANVAQATEKLQINSFLADYRNKMKDIAVKNTIIKMNAKQIDLMQAQIENIVQDSAKKHFESVNEYLRQENFERNLKKDYDFMENEIRKSKIFRSGMIWSSIIGESKNIVESAIKLAFPIKPIKGFGK